jgi:limonene-1,2-epoxide hydrolase
MTDAHPVPGEPSPILLVRRFFELLEQGDVEAAAELLDPAVRYVNVPLPAMRGRERTKKVLAAVFGRRGVGLEVYMHSICESEGTVLTERTDVIVLGPVRVQVWVCGRFDVAGGRIVFWKDYFDWLNTAVATVRGVLAVLVPALGPKPPAPAR